MTTTTKDTDFVGRALITPDTDAHDYMGRVVTADLDFLGRALVETEEEPPPEEEFILEDDWTGADGADWDLVKWPLSNGAGVSIQSNAGQFSGARSTYTAVTATDFELLIKATANTLGGNFAEIGWRVATPGLGSGYALQCNGSSGDLNRISSYANVASSASSGLNVSGTFWFRVRVVGTSHKVRWWADGGSEPGTWQIDATDATYASGAFMLRTYAGGTTTWDDLTITDLA